MPNFLRILKHPCPEKVIYTTFRPCATPATFPAISRAQWPGTTQWKESKWPTRKARALPSSQVPRRALALVYADRLARRGYDLILVARNQERLNALAKKLTSATGRSIEVVPADLNARADLARVEKILREDASITMLVNNAGVGAIMPLLDTDVNKMDRADSAQRRGIDPPDLCCCSGLCVTRRRHDHQYLLGRRHRA